MRILIVRHAEPDYAHDSLTEKGHREAALLAKRLARIPTKAYYVSPLGRAQRTAEYTLRLTGRKAETLPWLREFHGYALDMKTGEKRIPWDYRAEDWNDRPLLWDRTRWMEDALVAGGTVADVWRETREGADALMAVHGYTREGAVYRCVKNSSDTLVIFCHYGIGMALLSYLTNLPPVPMWQSFVFLPSSVTTLITQERKPGTVEFRCVCAGDVSHLEECGEPVSRAGLYPEIYNGVDSTDPARWPDCPAEPVLR